jgi:CRP-like cAMP-binding protein
LRKRMEASPALREQLHKYAYESYIDVALTALANASLTVEERLARWLLMCADRLATNCISLTHECLAIMLNVRRAGVTVALRSLQTAGLVNIRRGRISISDRPRLEHLARDTYRPIS